MKKRSYASIGLVGCLLFQMSCGPVDETIPTTATTTTSTVGVVDNSGGFYLNNISVDDTVTYYLHAQEVGATDYAEDFSHPCTISKTTTAYSSAGDMTCILEANELDLYFWGVQLQWNVSAGMCNYVRFRPYYFYAFQPGAGPTTVSVTKDATGAITATSALPANRGSVLGDGTPICNFDYSNSSYGLDGGGNCCTGTYILTTDNNGTISTSSGSWGGDYANCLSGPGMKGEIVSGTGYPKDIIYNVTTSGANKAYEIDPIIDQDFFTWQIQSTLYAANYFEPTDHTNLGANGGPVPAYSPYYSWECLDAAHEVKYRIRLMIRDWDTNTNGEFDTMVANKGVTVGQTPWDTANPLTDTEPNFSSPYVDDLGDWRFFELLRASGAYTGAISDEPYPGINYITVRN